MVDAKRLPESEWNALCHVSCSDLLGGKLALADGTKGRG